MWLQFTAVPQSVGAPLRTVTVRDAIADLPAIENGHDQAEMQYSGMPGALPVSSTADMSTDRSDAESNICKRPSTATASNVCKHVPTVH